MSPEIVSQLGVVGLALVVAFFVIDKIIPLLRGTNTNGSNGVAHQQIVLLNALLAAQVKSQEALAELLFIARDEAKYYRTRNGS